MSSHLCKVRKKSVPIKNNETFLWYIPSALLLISLPCFPRCISEVTLTIPSTSFLDFNKLL